MIVKIRHVIAVLLLGVQFYDALLFPKIGGVLRWKHLARENGPLPKYNAHKSIHRSAHSRLDSLAVKKLIPTTTFSKSNNKNSSSYFISRRISKTSVSTLIRPFTKKFISRLVSKTPFQDLKVILSSLLNEKSEPSIETSLALFNQMQGKWIEHKPIKRMDQTNIAKQALSVGMAATQGRLRIVQEKAEENSFGAPIKTSVINAIMHRLLNQIKEGISFKPTPNRKDASMRVCRQQFEDILNALLNHTLQVKPDSISYAIALKYQLLKHTVSVDTSNSATTTAMAEMSNLALFMQQNNVSLSEVLAINYLSVDECEPLTHLLHNYKANQDRGESKGDQEIVDKINYWLEEHFPSSSIRSGVVINNDSSAPNTTHFHSNNISSDVHNTSSGTLQEAWMKQLRPVIASALGQQNNKQHSSVLKRKKRKSSPLFPIILSGLKPERIAEIIVDELLQFNQYKSVSVPTTSSTSKEKRKLKAKAKTQPSLTNINTSTSSSNSNNHNSTRKNSSSTSRSSNDTNTTNSNSKEFIQGMGRPVLQLVLAIGDALEREIRQAHLQSLPFLTSIQDRPADTQSIIRDDKGKNATESSTAGARAETKAISETLNQAIGKLTQITNTQGLSAVAIASLDPAMRAKWAEIESKREQLQSEWIPAWPIKLKTQLAAYILNLGIQSLQVTTRGNTPTVGTQQQAKQQPAFTHHITVEKNQKQGYVLINPMVFTALTSTASNTANGTCYTSDNETNRCFNSTLLSTTQFLNDPLTLPMSVPPKLWLTTRCGGYYNYSDNSCMRWKNDDVQREVVLQADGEGVLHRMLSIVDMLGSVQWEINSQVLSVADKLWNAGVPLTTDNLYDSVKASPSFNAKSTHIGDATSEASTAIELLISETDTTTPTPAAPMLNRLQKARLPFRDRNTFSSQEEYVNYVQKSRQIKDEINKEYNTYCETQAKLTVAHLLNNSTGENNDDANNKDKVGFYFPYALDFRGRAYPIPSHLSHIGNDLCRGLLQFHEGKPLGETGLSWLYIHLANTAGLSKQSFNDRVQYVLARRKEIIASANDPLGEFSTNDDERKSCQWWMQASDPWQCLAACKDVAKAWELPDPTRYISKIPVQMDGTCNGLQHYAAMGRDGIGARQVNLSPSDTPQDVYLAVSQLVEQKLHTVLSPAGTASDNAAITLACVKQRLTASKQTIKAATKTISATHTVTPLSKPEMAQILMGKITRQVVKQTVMTNVYGVTRYGARNQIENRLYELHILPSDLNRKHKQQVIKYIVDLIFDSLDKIFTNAQKIQKWLTETSAEIAKSVSPEAALSIEKQYRRESSRSTSPATTTVSRRKVSLTADKATRNASVTRSGTESKTNTATTKLVSAPQKLSASPSQSQQRQQQQQQSLDPLTLYPQTAVMWTTPLGLPVVQPYRKSKSIQIHTDMQRLNVRTESALDPIHISRQSSSMPPNFIHSLDATHMMLTGEECGKKNVTFASVHDSFWTHAGTVDTMNGALRETFMTLHNDSVMERLRNEFVSRYSNNLVPVWKTTKRKGKAGKLRGWRKIQISALPITGDFQLSDVKESEYFFC